VVRTLRNAISQNRLAHAYLFVGPRGTGKTSVARIFAKALNCPDGPSVDFDPNNEICLEIEKGICLDVREIDGASNNGVDQVRELREEVKFAPTRCRYKIYYIDEVHMLSTAAFNALLKTLEEPPEHVKFIFATTEAHKVLPTIISRCQRFDLRRIPAGLIAKHLMHIASLEKINLVEKAAYAIAKGADGGMRDAQSMLDQLVAFCGEQITEQDVLDIFGFTRGEAVATLAKSILDQDTVAALRELHTQADSGKDLSRMLADLIQHFRTLLVHQVDNAAAEEDLSPEVAAMVQEQAAMVRAEPLLRVMDGLAEVDARMRWASNKLLHMEIAAIQAVQTLGEVTLSEVMAAIGGTGTPETVVRRAVAQPTPRPPVVAAVKPREPEVAKEMIVEKAPVASVVPPVAKAEPVAPVKAQETEPEPEPEPEPMEAPVVESESESAPTDESPGDFWKRAVERVHTDRPLIASWIELGTLLGIEGKTVTMGLPVTEVGAQESLMRAPTRKFLEGIFTELMGRDVLFNVVLDASLQPPPATEMTFGFGDMDAAPKTPAKPEPKEDPKPVINEDFYKDTLIQAALVKFKATLVK
ncbi:MAG: polymerase subunit gamma/tau, partial [Verrucomicrobiota bacterium]